MTLKLALTSLVVLMLMFFAPAAMAWQSGVCSVSQECRNGTRSCEDAYGKSVSLRLNDDGVTGKMKTSEFTTNLTVTERDESSITLEGTVDGRRVTVALDSFGSFFFTRSADDGVELTSIGKCRKVFG
jgi:hypothetical protein